MRRQRQWRRRRQPLWSHRDRAIVRLTLLVVIQLFLLLIYAATGQDLPTLPEHQNLFTGFCDGFLSPLLMIIAICTGRAWDLIATFTYPDDPWYWFASGLGFGLFALLAIVAVVRGSPQILPMDGPDDFSPQKRGDYQE